MAATEKTKEILESIDRLVAEEQNKERLAEIQVSREGNCEISLRSMCEGQFKGDLMPCSEIPDSRVKGRYRGSCLNQSTNQKSYCQLAIFAYFTAEV